MPVFPVVMDKDCSHDIMLTNTLLKMGLEWDKSMSYTKTIIHFIRDICPVIEKISLPLTTGEWPKAIIQKISIIDLSTPYNEVLGRPSQDLFWGNPNLETAINQIFDGSWDWMHPQ